MKELIKNTYNNIANKYDSLYEDDFSKIERLLILEDLEKLIKEGGSLLDVGCGTGKTEKLINKSKYLSKIDLNITGVDLSNQMIDIAKKNQNLKGEYLIKDFIELQETKTYDYIVSLFSAFSYIGIERGLNKIFKLLKNDGLFYFIIYSEKRGHPDYYTNEMKNYFKKRISHEKISKIIEETKKTYKMKINIYGLSHNKNTPSDIKLITALLRDLKSKKNLKNANYFIITNKEL